MDDIPHDDLPRSPSGRVPKWVADEARTGKEIVADPWRQGPTVYGPPATVQTAGVSQNDLTELQKRIITMMRSELETRERVQAPAVRTAQVVPASMGPTDQLAQEIDQIRRNQIEFSRTVSADMNNIMNKINERSVTPISFSGVERR